MRSEANDATARSVALRDHRAELVADGALSGSAFGAALADELDRTVAALLTEAAPTGSVALVALGSYARREVCPGSDVDLLLLYTEPKGLFKRRSSTDVKALAEHIWYPLWDAGFVLGHAARTVRDSVTLAEEDLDAMTALLCVRHVAGDEQLSRSLVEAARELAVKRADKLRAELAAGAETRRAKPGPVAEMLEPNLKDGAGGLRDIQSLEWLAATFGGAADLTVLQTQGLLDPGDAQRLSDARALLLDVRVALHRLTGGKSDLLTLQDQDAVAAALERSDADALVRELAGAAREVAWVTRDVFARVVDDAERARRVADEMLTPRIALRAGRIALVDDGPVDALVALEAAAEAADRDLPFDRATLERLSTMAAPTWDVWQRAAFMRILRAGARAVPVFEALDHAGVLVRIIPEWEHVRSLPQRNAYHRFTVDRHLLEAVAECAALLDAADAPVDAPVDASVDAAAARPLEGVVARACRRPELLLLGALLHDIGKGLPGDHAVVGAQMARDFGRRIGLDSEGNEILVWLVRDHLVMAETATRRDLSDEHTVRRFADLLVGDGERLRLLYLLTIGDSRATGPAAWNRSKAALVRDLLVKAAAVVEQDSAHTLVDQRAAALGQLIGEAEAASFLERMPGAYPLAFEAETMAHHARILAEGGRCVECALGPDKRVVVTVVVPDRSGLLASVAGALTVSGLAVHEANVFSSVDGIAIDVFRADDPFGRAGDGGLDAIEQLLTRALDGEVDLMAGVEQRRRDYQVLGRSRSVGPVEVSFHLDDSETSTVVEVHAPDQVGVLYRIAGVFAQFGLDVRLAKVETLGDRVVDVFYLRDRDGSKIIDAAVLDDLDRAIVAALTD